MDWPEITKETAVDEIFEIHRRIWDETIKNFIQTDIVEKPGTPYRSNCAFCEYAHIHRLPCCRCLADWGTGVFKYPLRCTNNDDFIVFSLGYADERTLEAIKRIRNIPRSKI